MKQRFPRNQAQRKGRQSRRRGPEKLSNILADLIIQRGYARQMTASEFQEAWKKSAKGLLANGSRPGTIRNGVLEVIVRNSTLMQELTFEKKHIIKKLNEELEHVITDLRFRIGTID